MRSHAKRLVAASGSFDERVDAWLEPFRGAGRGQQALYATSLLAEAVLLGWGGATALADSPHAQVTRRRVGSVALAGLLTIAVKGVVGRARPFAPSQRPVRVEPDTTSFPSGHALWATLAALWLAHERWSPHLAYPLAGFVGLSRVHLRLHRATDVLAAVAIAATAWAAGRRA